MSGGQDCTCGPDECTCFPPSYKDDKPLIKTFELKGLRITIKIEALYLKYALAEYKAKIAALIYQLLNQE